VTSTHDVTSPSAMVVSRVAADGVKSSVVERWTS
jgi:hypothetical protein